MDTKEYKFKVYFISYPKGSFDKSYIIEEYHRSRYDAELRAKALNWGIQNIVELDNLIK